MDEFIGLFLRGKYADEMKKYIRIVRIVSLCGLLALAAALIAGFTQKAPLALTLSFSVCGFVCEAVSGALILRKPRLLARLASAQNEENKLMRSGEERECREKVYGAYCSAFARFTSPARIWTIALLRTLSSAAVAAAGVLVSAQIMVDETVLFVLCACSFIAGGLGVYDTVLESRARAEFYRSAQNEIDSIKREELHITEERAAKEAENARAASSVPAPVELFLKDDTEREDYRSVSRRSSVTGLALGALYFLVIVAGMAFGNALEQLGSGAGWAIVLSVFAAIFAGSVVSVFPLMRRQGEIFARNAAKLADTETDRSRAELQGMWIRSQRAGNVMFGCFMGAAIVLGVTLGLIGYFTNADGMPLAQSLAVAILPILVYAALISLAVWVVMYAVARSKMRPVENKLREHMRTERS